MTPTFPIKPEQFWTVFSDAIRADADDPEKQVRQIYNSAAPWTPYMTELVMNLSAKFSCVSYKEFWPRIDVSYFDKCGADWSEWALEVAIELENNIDWHQELAKLLMVNAGLKVLIAYEDNQQTIRDSLEKFVQIHASRKYQTSNCSWLLIFGPRLIPASRDFLAFAFDGKVITDITGARQTIGESLVTSA